MTDSRQQAARDVTDALAPLSRRRFLKTALWATAGLTAVLAGGFAVLRRSPLDTAPVPAGLRYLTASQYQLFNRLAHVLLPTDGTALFPAEQVPVAAHIDAILGTLEPEVREQLGMGLALFDNAAVAGHWKRFVDLDDAAALAYVNDWLNASAMPKRAIGFVVSKLTHTGYWLDERTWPAIEFDGAVTKKWGISSRGNQPLPA
ncbi:MAG: gluconate 2-dehydrogenase subunit 3 family protein [Moraxellaceae bacterium]|nr:gluconate 2-dehydrogenase subunit 3 family protein [Moraxellaceae bacterium]